jgi:hypothetical protein
MELIIWIADLRFIEMTLLHMDGFDSYAIASDLSMEYVSYTCGVVTNAGRYEGGALYFNDYDISIIWSPRSSFSQFTQVWTGFALQIQEVTGLGIITSFASLAGKETEIYYNSSTGAWDIVVSGIVATETYLLTAGDWYWVEIYYLMKAESVGNVNVSVMGTEVVSYSGVTSKFGSGFFYAVILGDSGDGLYPIYIDDWYIGDTSGNYGDSRIQTLLPTSDAGPNNGTPSTAGDHYLMVDEQQWNSSNNIVLSNTSGQEEIFNTAILTGNIEIVHAVRILAVVEKTSTGNVFANTTIISNGVVNSYGGSFTPLLETYSHVFNIFEYGNVNANSAPASSWTNVLVNSSSCGITII